MKMLIIRPEPGNSASAARAREAGFDPVPLPFFAIATREWICPAAANYDALLLTSANAVRHAGGGLIALSQLPIYAVGGVTAHALQSAKLPIYASGTSGVQEVLEAAYDAGHRRVIWLAGEDHHHPILPNDMALDIRIVYSADALDVAHAGDLVGTCDFVALHSVRAALQFANQVDKWKLPRGRFSIAAFSPAIADAAGEGWRAVIAAKMPEDSALLSAALQLVKDNG